MANLGILNKNAGNLRDPSTGEFQKFNTPEEGYQALVKDLEIKKSGKSAHIKPGGSILALANVWAPASDNNNPNDWANNVAKTIGKKPTDTWADVPTDQLAKGIQVAEGTSSPSTVNKPITSNTATSKMSLEEFGKTIQQKYPEYAGKDATLVGQKVLDKYPEYANRVEGKAQAEFPLSSQADKTPPPLASEPLPPGANQPIPGVIDQAKKGNYLGALSSMVRKTGSALTGGGTETLGNAIGTLGGYLASSNKKEYDTSAPSIGETAMAGVKTVASAAGIKGAGGLLNKAILSRGPLANSTIKSILERSLNTRGGETLANLSRQEAQMTLQNYLKEMPVTEVGSKTAQQVVKALQALDPSYSKPAGFVKNLVKFGISTLVIENLVRRVFGERASSAVATMAGMINP